MRIRVIILLIAVFFTQDLLSQGEQRTTEDGKSLNVLFRNEGTMGFFAHTRGFGLNYRRGWHVTGQRKRMIEIEGLNMRHSKEIKEKSNIRDNAKGFYYGKLNSVFLLRLGIGFQNVIYRRADRKSVEIRCSYLVGPQLTFAKPIYLTILKENQFQQKDFVVEKYDPAMHDLSNIVGRAPFVNGIERTKLYPGAYAKLAFSFEYADYSNEVKAIEIGTVVDVYPIALPIMANYAKENYIVTLYISFVFGKKWF